MEKDTNIIQTKVTKKSVIVSLIWKFLERGGNEIAQFVIQIILARLLMPNDYGMIAILLAFINIANIFIQTGFNTALIQKRDSDQTDFSSVFYLSLFIAGLLYAVLFITAPVIAKYLNRLY